MAYSVWGHGTKHLLCFHGYGLNRDFYLPLVSHLPSYTIYSFDLFFHGDSQWMSSKNYVGKYDLNECIRLFLEKHQISEFQILGYSMGARFALSVFESFAEHTQKVILMAPDGISFNFWFAFATYNGISNALFKWVVMSPPLLYILRNTLKSMGWIDKSVSKFVMQELDTPTKRLRVYHSWTYFCKLQLGKELDEKKLQQYSYKMILVLGTLDKIITTMEIIKRIKHWDVTMHKVQSGHTMLLKNLIDNPKTFREIFENPN